MNNIIPLLQLKPPPVTPSNYQLPLHLPPQRPTTLPLPSLLNYPPLPPQKTIQHPLPNEILHPPNNTPPPLNKPHHTHKIPQPNKPFPHYPS
ncbi:uS7 family ribosomal protein [Staphylococcus haemolyticus]|uniref:hypothetical protein n=1 Tax=Staphylococcus haemolyticus TaxID=1283 RepID=UPI00374F02FA